MEEWREELAEIRAIMADTAKKTAEDRKDFAEIREQQKESEKEWSEIRKLQEENAKGFAKLRELHEKNEKLFERVEKLQEENAKSFAELHKELGGIGDSNGKFSESYFYSTLFNSMHFGGKDFDNIDKGLKRSKKLPDGKKLTGEYDVVMYNGNTIALIEVKYKVKKNHIDNLATNQVKVFKELFPQYANFDFYLGIAGLSFEDNTEKEALEQGIGILRPKGENVEIIDDNLKVY